MPELPDVEIFRRYFMAHGLRRPIRRAEVRDAGRMLEGVSAAELNRALEGRSVTAADRHGKYLFARIEKGGWLMLHFGMTGYLTFGEAEEHDPAHNRLILHFREGSHLAFNCRRKLGAIGLTGSPARFIEEKGLGPDALALDEDGFLGCLDGRGGSIKGLLMDQTVIAGIGNIYSDEILFQAAVHPRMAVDGLDPAARRRLYAAMKSVLETAIEANAEPERFPEGFLTPQRKRKGGHCPYCGGSPHAITVVGRTAWFCPCRQPVPERPPSRGQARPQ